MKSIPDLDFIIWTGNTASHELFNLTSSDRSEAIETVTEELENLFANIPIYPVIGTWDTTPAH